MSPTERIPRAMAERDMALSAQCPAQGAYTVKQGQYLAFIYYYTKIHGRSPSEADMQGYFRVSPPSVPSDGPSSLSDLADSLSLSWSSKRGCKRYSIWA